MEQQILYISIQINCHSMKLILLSLLLLLATTQDIRILCGNSLLLTLNRGFQYVFRSAGGSGQYRYEISGLPPGLQMQGPVLAGIPTKAGTYPITLYCYDDKGASATKKMVMNVGQQASGAQASFPVDISLGATVGSSSVGSSSSSQQSRIVKTTTTTTTQSSSSSGSGQATPRIVMKKNKLGWFEGTGAVVPGPYETDGKGFPIFRTDGKGRYVFKVDSQGAFILPRDPDGLNIYPDNEKGWPILPLDNHNRFVFPLDARGFQMLPRNRDGMFVFPLDNDGNPIAPTDSQGVVQLPLDFNGNPIKPTSTPIAPSSIFPKNNNVLGTDQEVTQTTIVLPPPPQNGGKQIGSSIILPQRSQSSRTTISQVSGNSVIQVPLGQNQKPIPNPNINMPSQIGNLPDISLGNSLSKTSTTTTTITRVNSQTNLEPSLPQPILDIPLPKLPPLASLTAAPKAPIQSYPTTNPFSNSILPMQISNYQYKVNPDRDTYKSSVLDIENQAVFLRQINANKAISNILSVIQTLTANVNGVQADIPVANDALNKALSQQRTIQTQIASAQTSNKTLHQNIQTIRENIIELQKTASKTRSQITSAQEVYGKYKTQTITFKQTITASEQRLTSLNRALGTAQAELKQSQANVGVAQSTIITSQNKIKQIEVDIENAPRIKEQADLEANKIKQRIQQLEAELQRARADLQTAQNKSDYFSMLPSKGALLIRQEQMIIQNARSQLSNILQPAVQKSSEAIRKVTKAISQAQASVSQSSTSIEVITRNTANYQKIISDLNTKFNGLVKSITSAASQLNNLISLAQGYSNAVIEAYNKGNYVNDKVVNAKTILGSLNAKYSESVVQLNEAKGLLEKARSEKEIADIAVNQQIKRTGGNLVLPFALPTYNIPGANYPANGGFFPVGSTDTTQRGSQPRPPPTQTQISINGIPTLQTTTYSSSSSLNINTNDLTHFFSDAYTAGVDPIKLYPFIFTFKSIQPKMDCSVLNSQDKNAATISRIMDNGFEVEEGGKGYRLVVGDCTRMAANRENYRPNVGDRIRWRGSSSKQEASEERYRTVNAAAIACYGQ